VGVELLAQPPWNPPILKPMRVFLPHSYFTKDLHVNTSSCLILLAFPECFFPRQPLTVKTDVELFPLLRLLADEIFPQAEVLFYIPAVLVLRSELGPVRLQEFEGFGHLFPLLLYYIVVRKIGIFLLEGESLLPRGENLKSKRLYRSFLLWLIFIRGGF